MSQITVRIAKKDSDELLSLIERHSNRQVLSSAVPAQGDSVLVTIDRSQAAEFQSELTEILAVRGLGRDSEPNELGLRIERWLDIFNLYQFD